MASLSAAWLLPARWQVGGIALCGAVFLALASPVSLLVSTISSLLVYLSVRRGQGRLSVLLATIGGLTAVFVCFKYRVGSVAHAVLPIGLSYYTFRMIHYALESAKGSLRDHDVRDYLCYLFFMPVLLVGPIHRFPEFLRDVRRRRFDRGLFLYGLERAYYGYAKVIILGSLLVSSWIPPILDSCPGWARESCLGPCLDWLNLYIQFSGYSDIAIGAAAMCGFRVIENFHLPFLASNIADFWRRWHISLTSWCRDYVYAPIAALTRNRTLSMMSAMVAMGLWHEFSLRYILWGAYHAGGIAVYGRYTRWVTPAMRPRNPCLRIAGRIVGTFITLTFVVLSYPITKSLDQGLRELWALIAS